ncbi:MAG: guanylate cyclase [Sneathiella sp.]|uniref:adenylate/guanylate cyclase domain-containing protein n=1 Tax=Sneathiella sp. TaxID=1964365 RepID=UPI000C3A16CF|nr:adenylate/guanylate cyclase domain-containing protein [Sneathiella sp.]MAZ02159.1 guanylate cyclase [Sneathiella sp.]
MNEDARILVVDDNEDNRFTLSRRLKKSGYRQLETAVNGIEALEKIRSKPFDLVLLDIMMPEMDGYEVLETVKKDEALRHIPIIMISAADQLESVVKCIELGAEDFLPKPFNATLLRARVSASLEKKRLRDQEEAYRAQILAEQKRTDELLHAIIPATAVQELKETGIVRPRHYEAVGILFCDIVGFTAYCDRNLPETVVAHLQALIEAFEGIVEDHQMEKIKTIGDAFMATSGLLRPVEAPLLTAVRCGLEMSRIAGTMEPNWEVRIGLHFGPVVAGIVGKQQFLFDVWGDTVNIAARLVEHGTPGAVAMTAAAWQEIKEECDARALGVIDIKGKGQLDIVEAIAIR